MQATLPPTTIATAPAAVLVTVAGGQQTSALDGPHIADPDFKSAIEASLTNARAFQPQASGSTARYALRANIVRLTKPMWGGTFTVELEVAWTLVDQQQNKVLLRKAITASGTATMAEAFAGATRIRLAVEAAARANIEQLLRELATVTY